MIRTGKKFSKPEMSRVINGDTILPEAEQPIEKCRLDVLMHEIFRSYNRSTLQKFIESGFVTVNGSLVTKPNARFARDVKIELEVPEKLKNADIKPEVVYEDEHVIVVNKPAGLLSEAKGEYCPERTLADFGMVAHRLDRDTSGVMVLAKDDDTLHFLKRQFQKRTVHKTYYAVVEGRPKLEQAKIDLPILRDMKRPTTFRVDPNGKESQTFYRLLKTNGDYSLVELRPITGRTHQLRVHMQYLGHPIVGDRVYGKTDGKRLFLHAGELELTLPGGNRRIFRVPRPRSFDALVSAGSTESFSKGEE